MVVINGGIAKETIVSYFLDHVERNDESNDSNLEQRSPKRRKLSDHSIVLAHIVMPLQLNDTSLQTLSEYAPSGMNTTAENLQIGWTSEKIHVDQQDFMRSRMMLRKEGVLLAENDSIRPTDDLDDLSILARACKHGGIECGSFRITCNDNTLYPSNITSPSYDTVEEFFRHLQPPVSEKKIIACQSPELMPVLTPFQSQNVEWMLNREGHYFASDTGVINPMSRDPHALPFFWDVIHPEGPSSTPLYINRSNGQILSKPNAEFDRAIHLTRRGGILADEMGLGKTVCVIALLLLHKLDIHDPTHPKQETGLLTTGATLIITPSAILQQWESELKLHAPSLKVTTYRGLKASKGKAESVESLSKFDVVLTDYKVLQEEIYHARAPPSRPRRHATKYPSERSPLVQLLWFRVIIDEAQMVEGSMGLMVEMAMLIPRWYAWGVSGTPIKSTFDDLFGLCRFLSFTPSIERVNQFRSLYRSSLLFKGLFWDFAQQIMRRNVKAMLTSQIHIPHQHRRVVKVAFSSIEQHYYQSLWEQCSQSTNFELLDQRQWKPSDNDPSTSPEMFQQVYAKLRTWLLTLRQACVHPTIGSQSKNRLINQAVRTLDEVLNALVVQVKDEIDNVGHQLATARLRRAGMWEIQKNWETAREIYQSEAIPHLLELIQATEERMTQVKAAEEQAEKKADDTSHDRDQYAVAHTRSVDDYRVQALLQRKLKHLSALHRCYFFLAGIFHEMKQEQQETEYYDKAANVRREILSRAEERVNSSKKDIMKPLKPIHLQIGPSPQKETIRFSFDLLDRVNTLAQVLDDQVPHLEKCRAELQKLLCANLVDYGDGEEATGDEYEQSLLVQEKIDIYQSVYQAMLSDRNFWINGVWVSGLRSDMEEQQEEAKKALDGQADEENDDTADIRELKAEMWNTRSSFAPRFQGSDNFRLVISRLRDIVSNPATHEVERHIISTEIGRLNTAVSKQREMQERLETEYRRFTTIYNHRVEYYRSLQAISDDVVAWTSDDPQGEIQRLVENEKRFDKIAKEKSARCRYLENIAKEKQHEEGPRKCLICMGEFSKGLMTFCGHMYCKECANLWFKAHRRCPQCNKPVVLQECYQIAWGKGEEKQVENSTHQTNDVPISYELLQQINQVEAIGGLGAKLDSIVRHIKHIVNTTGGKSVVFSQWKDVLDLLAGGLKRNNIGCIQLDGIVRDDRIKQFREDLDTHVILLHARSQSSGLTLVAAHTVFIVEPVLNESLEKQAISRVHRIGQTKETTVFWYIVQDTIEERIHAIQLAHRQRRITVEQGNDMDDDDDNDTVSGNPVTLENRSEGGGERVCDEDLQRCFTSDEAWALHL
ncbi:hypothetical protein K492DRAFT_235541 [Lichtheimia hyalospora FSU 10163]|nr:hypothetical protein K492DRAFT_235541 [Lichtheimia hyalospora FSU 10163]